MPGIPRTPSAVWTGAFVRIEPAQPLPVEQRVILPAGMAEHEVALTVGIVAGRDDLADRAALHDGPDLDGLRVGFRGAHPAAHIGVE
jgi:hypothetical protein